MSDESTVRYHKRFLQRPRVCLCGMAIVLTCLMLFTLIPLFQTDSSGPFVLGAVPDPIARVTDFLTYTGPPQKVAQDWIKELNLSQSQADENVCLRASHIEDFIMMEHFLGRVTGGFFVELGGHDGYSFSTTTFFELRMNWSGLLVEASPSHAATFHHHYAKLRPRVEFVQTAVCESATSVNYVTDFNCSQCFGIHEFFPEKQQEDQRRRCHVVGNAVAQEPIYNLRRRYGTRSCIISPLPCMRVDDLLRQRGVWKVDLFVLDVEGAEANVLRTVDLVRGPPIHFFIVELKGRAEAKDREVRRMLRGAGYVPHGRIHVNEVWERTDFDSALRSYVRRVCGVGAVGEGGGACGAAGGAPLYGPDADAEYHRRHTADCFRGNVAPSSFHSEGQWTPPFRTVGDAL